MPPRRTFRRPATVIAALALPLLLPAGCAAASVRPSPAAPPAGACAPAPPSAEAVRLPFRVVDGRIYVEAMVNDQGPFVFAIDTGASGMGRADASLTAALALPPDGSGAASDGVATQEVAKVRIASIRLGGDGSGGAVLEQRDLSVITRDYSGRMRAEARIAGIIGRDFFADGVLTIDYGARVVDFDPGASLAADDPAALPYARAFRVPVTVGGEVVEAQLDTGANGGVIMPRALYDRVGGGPLQAAGDATLTNGAVATESGIIPGPIRLGSLELGDTAPRRGVAARVSDRFPEMVIGAHILQQYRIRIDQRARRVALCPLG